jgi:hypothetical protein
VTLLILFVAACILLDAIVTVWGIRRGRRELNPFINLLARLTSVGFAVGIGVIGVSSLLLCCLVYLGQGWVAFYAGIRAMLAYRQLITLNII